MAKYKFELTSRIGTRDVLPLNANSLVLSWEQDNNRSDFTQKLGGKIVLGGQDFNWLNILEKSQYRCESVQLNITKLCVGGYVPFFNTEISLNSGTWDQLRCKVSLEASDNEKYRCFENNKNTEYNLFNFIAGRQTVAQIRGELQTHTVSDTITGGGAFDPFPGEPSPTDKGWLQQAYSEIHSGPDTIDYSTTWVREILTPSLTSPGTDWILVGSDIYARLPVLYSQQFGTYDPLNPSDYSYTYSVFTATIDNGLALRDIMQFLISNSCPGLTLKSDFFQWNPDTVTNINYATAQASKVLNLVFFQKSDVKRASATDNATAFKTTPEKFIQDLCNTFQLEWEITDDGKFKIEHVSFKNNITGIDATLSSLMAGKKIYSYDQEQLPERETFRFMENSPTGDFGPGTIVYTGACIGTSKSQDYLVENFTTDVVLCINNPSRDSKIEDNGFVPIATDGAGFILSEPAILGGNTVNNTLAWAQLQRDYWRYKRPQRNFIMNSLNTQAITIKPTKQEDNVKVYFGCDNTFYPDRLIKTFIGTNGILKNAKYNLFTEVLDLSVLFPADDNLTINAAPIAVDDTADTAVDTPVIVDVLANDSDPEGHLDDTTLEIIGQPANGLAEVIPDGGTYKIRYIPQSGFSGTNFIVYRVSDNFKEPSNNALLTINVS